jgi:outer membrane lipoprotein-sorting protein
MALPAIVQVTEASGKDSTFTLPVEIWQRGATWTFAYPSTSKLKSVVLDPDNVLPDVNSQNNEWKAIEKKAVPAGVTAESVVKKYLDAIGGESKLKTVKDLTIQAAGSIQGQDIVITREYKMPDKFKMEVTLPSMDNRVVSKILMNGDSVTMQRMGQDMPVSEDAKKSLQDELHLFHEQQYLKPGYQLSLESIEPVNDQDAYVLKVTDPEGNVSTSYYDVKTGLKVKEIAENPSPGMAGNNSATTYSDYQEVNGIKFPFTIGTTAGGMNIELKVKNLKVNSGLTDADFK